MRVNLSVDSFLRNRPVKILCTNLARSCLYEQSWWQRNRPSPKCSLKVGSIARRRSVICHSREHFHWWRAWHHCILHFLWCSVMSGLDATAQPWKPWHPLIVHCEFTWPTALWVNSCRFHFFIIPLTVEYLVVGKFHNLTSCTDGILSQYHSEIHWAPESDAFFHKCL